MQEELAQQLRAFLLVTGITMFLITTINTVIDNANFHKIDRSLSPDIVKFMEHEGSGLLFSEEDIE